MQMLGERLHRTGTRLLSLVMVLLGLALSIESASSGGSVLSARLLIGVLLLAAGVGRLYVEARRGRA